MKQTIIFCLCLAFGILHSNLAIGQDFSVLGMPAITASDGAEGSTTYSLSLQILLLMTALTVLPSLVLGMTAFTRIIIVLSILRQALGTQQTPPNQVLIAVALFLSFFIMGPVFEVLYRDAISPFLDGNIGIERAITDGVALLKEFMVANTRSDTLNLFVDLSNSGPFANEAAVPLNIVLPAFITSELKTAFEIGFLIFLPFLVIDMVVSNILLAMGAMMVSPVMISLPIKILFFVAVDGWSRILHSLLMSYA